MSGTAIVDYMSLQSVGADYLFRAGDAALSARFPEFVDQFEREWMDTQRLFGMQKGAGTWTAITAGTATVAVPADYLEGVRFTLAGIAPLDYVTPDVAGNMLADRANIQQPKYHTILGSNLYLIPNNSVPATTYEWVYYAFQQLGSTVPTNWLLAKYPDIYLFGSLMKAGLWIDDPATVTKWQSEFARRMTQADAADKKARKGSAGPLTMRPSTAVIA